MLRHYVNEKQNNWDDLLYAAEFVVNNAHQASIQDTPVYLNCGRHPRLPSDLSLKTWFPEDTSRTCGNTKAVKDPKAVHFIGNVEKAVAKAKDCLRAAQQRQKRYADEHRMEVQHEVGQLVWLQSTCHYQGCRLTQNVTTLVETIQDPCQDQSSQLHSGHPSSLSYRHYFPCQYAALYL